MLELEEDCALEEETAEELDWIALEEEIAEELDGLTLDEEIAEELEGLTLDEDAAEEDWEEIKENVLKQLRKEEGNGTDGLFDF